MHLARLHLAEDALSLPLAQRRVQQRRPAGPGRPGVLDLVALQGDEGRVVVAQTASRQLSDGGS